MQYERLLATGLFFCAAGQAYLLISLGWCGGLFERLGNVYGCEGWIFCLSY